MKINIDVEIFKNIRKNISEKKRSLAEIEMYFEIFKQAYSKEKNRFEIAQIVKELEDLIINWMIISNKRINLKTLQEQKDSKLLDYSEIIVKAEIDSRLNMLKQLILYCYINPIMINNKECNGFEIINIVKNELARIEFEDARLVSILNDYLQNNNSEYYFSYRQTIWFNSFLPANLDPDIIYYLKYQINDKCKKIKINYTEKAIFLDCIYTIVGNKGKRYFYIEEGKIFEIDINITNSIGSLYFINPNPLDKQLLTAFLNQIKPFNEEQIPNLESNPIQVLSLKEKNK